MIRDNLWRAAWIGFGLATTVLATLTITYRKTEGGWRWRDGKDSELIFKIVPRAEWEAESGDYLGSAHDRADGFLHFSIASQLPETLRLYYADQNDLMLVAVDPAALGAG